MRGKTISAALISYRFWEVYLHGF